MKKLLIVLFGILCCTNVTFAQFSNAKSSGFVGSSSFDGWSGLRFSYGVTKFKVDGESSDAGNQFVLSYAKAFALTQSVPLFCEIAPEVSYFIYKETDSYYDVTSKLMLMYAGIPVNFGYSIQINDNFSINPYVGLTPKVNILFKSKYEDDGDEEIFDLFEYEDAKRFQLGWQIGAGFNFGALNVGLGYYSDIIEIMENTKTGSFRITLGVNF